ncbi:MAG TPA: GWxTD domain-containing protein [Thermoanaerobaculia bacterium]|nr:GWxTD domain-containing protein [Thermoanaerobaculia bacterium]
MTGRNRARGWLAAALLPLTSWLSGCGSANATGGTAALVGGPTLWLMLPEEQKQARRLGSTREAVAYIESFWRRRDPDPSTPGNEFARTFYERVEAADGLYTEGGTRGSMTDRGRALILLGPPPMLRYSQERVPTWELGRPGSPPAVQSRHLVMESWVYSVADLPPELTVLLEAEGPTPTEIVLVFAAEPRRTYLVQGEKYLEMAARAAVRR